jgi:hypothetical protein
MALNLGILNASHVHCMKEACSIKTKSALNHSHTFSVTRTYLTVHDASLCIGTYHDSYIEPPPPPPAPRVGPTEHLIYSNLFFALIREYLTQR